jgi:ferritin-like metal-binding protein YciE
VEHYEISAYGTVRAVAEQLGESKVARLLAQTLAEEENADKLLTKLSPPLLQEASQEEELEDQER